MLVKDQIPAFPELISIHSVVDYVAHGVDTIASPRSIDGMYYSQAEREHAEELAFTKIIRLLQEGKIRATGRLSTTKKGKAARWQAQQYKQHSKMRSYIEPPFWYRYARPKSHIIGSVHTARDETKEYTDVMVVLEDCTTHLAEDLAVHQGSTGAPVSDYSTPYIDLMWRAVDKFKISPENQPIKETLVEWFMGQEIEGQKVARATAEYLASFVRLPSSRAGGNRPWRVRGQQKEDGA
jgi:hypothetical protein